MSEEELLLCRIVVLIDVGYEIVTVGNRVNV